MPDAIWIDRDDALAALAQQLASQGSIGVDTEFLRERTFFPKLCLLQMAAGDRIWCVDTLRISSLDPLMPALTAAAARKVIHAARQDLEAVYLSTKRVMSPVFDGAGSPCGIGAGEYADEYAEYRSSCCEAKIEHRRP